MPKMFVRWRNIFWWKLLLYARMPEKIPGGGRVELSGKSGWAGNVRELQHAIERAFILGRGNDVKLCVEHFQTFGESCQLRNI